MTATLNDVAKKRSGEPSAEQQAAAELVRQAQERLCVSSRGLGGLPEVADQAVVDDIG
jgi:hypothetical protein